MIGNVLWPLEPRIKTKYDTFSYLVVNPGSLYFESYRDEPKEAPYGGFLAPYFEIALTTVFEGDFKRDNDVFDNYWGYCEKVMPEIGDRLYRKVDDLTQKLHTIGCRTIHVNYRLQPTHLFSIHEEGKLEIVSYVEVSIAGDKND